jgi:hypothetical protein
LSRAPLLDGYCPDDGEMEKEKYKFDDEGNLIFNEIDDDDDDEKKMSPQHLDHSPLRPSTFPAVPANENRTRGSSAYNVSVRIGLDAKLQAEKIRRSGAVVEKV